MVRNSRNIFNSINVKEHCESIYTSAMIASSSTVFYSMNIVNSSKIYGCDNLDGCFECIACSGLVNKKYMISNKQFSKEEYYDLKDTYVEQLDRNMTDKSMSNLFCHDTENSIGCLNIHQ